MRKVVLMCVGVVFLTAAAQGAYWSAGDEWREAPDPTSVWSYRNLDGTELDEIVHNLFGWGVDAWVNDAASPGNPPIMFADPGHMVFAGWHTFEMHGPGMVRWTAPDPDPMVAGDYWVVNLNPGSGGFQVPGTPQRDVWWKIAVNGVVVNSAEMPDWGNAGEWPPVWAVMADGDGGLASVQNLIIHPGDTIDMQTMGDPTAQEPWATFAVFYLGIEGTHVVPEPATMGILGLGGLALLRRKK